MRYFECPACHRQVGGLTTPQCLNMTEHRYEPVVWMVEIPRSRVRDKENT